MTDIKSSLFNSFYIKNQIENALIYANLFYVQLYIYNQREGNYYSKNLVLLNIIQWLKHEKSWRYSNKKSPDCSETRSADPPETPNITSITQPPGLIFKPTLNLRFYYN